MQRRLRLPVAIVAGATVLALALPATASAGRGTTRPGASVAASSSVMNTSTKRHPFKIKAGRIYDVVATLRGVRRHDRLALEAHYRKRLRHPKRWHVIASWRLHRGQHHFREATKAAFPGLWTLRVQFLRHGHLLRGSQSNRFYVKVKRFRHPKPHRPRRHGLANPVLNDWGTVQCAYPDSIGTGIDVVSPITQAFGGGNNIYINTVVWVRDAQPGGQWTPWYIRGTQEQVLGGGPQVIGNEGADQTHITDVTIGYGGSGAIERNDLFHQIGWDVQVLGSDGLWRYISPNSFYEPGGYVQWPRHDSPDPPFGSANCETYAIG